MKRVLFLFIAALILSSCGPGKNSEEYKNSLSVKEFLFEHNYTLMIDRVRVTKYDDSENVNCKGNTVLELNDERGSKISELYLPDKEAWYKFPDTSFYVRIFGSG